ncbi:hypothetical protein OC861_001587 [Tilletia horrida]|nr:hypothetical protein OC861_001587 [Tilletia horrida]
MVAIVLFSDMAQVVLARVSLDPVAKDACEELLQEAKAESAVQISQAGRQGPRVLGL